MADLLTFSLSVFTGFFAIMNPIAGAPIFIGLVEGSDRETKQRINRTATVTAFVIVAIFVLLGKFIFEMFGITVPAFKITGGILIFYVGFEMLMSKKSDVKHIQNANVDENIAISPLATPFLAGPGTIVTAMNYTDNTDFLHIGVVIIIFALMCLITYYVFSLSEILVVKLGRNIITVVGKLMGLIIAIIGVGMVIEGVKISFGI
ncbi:MAG: NAAT family transporter [Flavobacteriales bacterium]|nr:NAAT family transporter [Flavobacteriales bacterium]